MKQPGVCCYWDEEALEFERIKEDQINFIGVGEDENYQSTCPMKYPFVDISNSIKNNRKTGQWKNIPNFSPHSLCTHSLTQELKVRDW